MSNWISKRIKQSGTHENEKDGGIWREASGETSEKAPWDLEQNNRNGIKCLSGMEKGGGGERIKRKGEMKDSFVKRETERFNENPRAKISRKRAGTKSQQR